jgi:hypothetical protein
MPASVAAIRCGDDGGRFARLFQNRGIVLLILR